MTSVLSHFIDLKCPAFAITTKGNWLGANGLFKENDSLYHCKAALIDHITPFLKHPHKTTACYFDEQRISLSLLRFEDYILVCCHQISTPEAIKPAITAPEQEQSSYAIVDEEQHIVRTNHPQLEVNKSALSQLPNLFSKPNRYKIIRAFSKLTNNKSFQFTIDNMGLSIVFTVSHVDVNNRHYLLVMWQPTKFVTLQVDGLNQRYSNLLKAVNYYIGRYYYLR